VQKPPARLLWGIAIVPTFFFWAAAVSVAFHPLLYPVLGLRRIVPGCDPAPGYWRRRLTLNLLETNLGMVLNLGLAVAVAVLGESGSALAWPLAAVAAGVDLLYTVAIVALTPRDWWHALPTGLALVAYGLALALA